MKNKQNLIIAVLAALVLILLVLLAYNVGKNAGLQSANQTSSNTTNGAQANNSGSDAAQPTQAPAKDNGSQANDSQSGEKNQTDSNTSGNTTAGDNQSGTQNDNTAVDDSQSDSSQTGNEQANNNNDNGQSGNNQSDNNSGTNQNSNSDQKDNNTSNDQPTLELPTDAVTLTIDNSDSWGESPKYYRMNMVLTNNTDEDIVGWILRINVGDNAAVDSSWRAVCSIENGILSMTNEDHNKKVPANGSIDFGAIMYNVTGDLSYTVEVLSKQNPNQANQGNGQAIAGLDVPAPTTDDWLHVEGNKIVDSEGKQVWLTGVNWFGYNTGTNIFDGIWNSDLNTSIQSIADHGFNLIRIPISAELLLQWKNGEYPTANYNHATNYYLENMNSLEIFDYVIGQCRANGLKLMIDIHSAKTDASGHVANMWYNGDITTEKFQEALVWMAERYAKDDTIIAYDLKNEPHGKPFETDKAIWNDSKDKNNWKYIAEQTALKILEKNPNVLIMVEGTEIYPIDMKANGDFSSKNDADYYFNWWGGNLRGVADYPIDLGKYQDQLVYSPHDYGPTVYQQPWFYEGYNFDSLYEDCWRDNWMYIYEDGTAPLLIGEWGGFMRDPNLTWMTHMRTLISKNHLHHTFWCFNANSGDTGGLVLDDFKTWDEEKYAFVKEVLWQENGKFVGLDHEIPLGTAGNGITLSEAKGLK